MSLTTPSSQSSELEQASREREFAVTSLVPAVSILRPGVILEKLPDVFDHPVFDDHELFESSGVVVELQNSISGDEADDMWQMYLRGFSALNASSLSRQSLDETEFKNELSDNSVIKYVARNSEGKPLGYMAVEKGLHRPDPSPYWPQQDDEVLSAVQSMIDPNAPSFYITTFLVDKQASEYMLSTSRIILRGALRHFREVSEALDADPVCFYDFAPQNHYLPDFITETGKPADNFEGVEIYTWPVYVAEWYQLSLEEVSLEKLESILDSMPSDAFSEGNKTLAVQDGIPLEIQAENLEAAAENYCTITNLPASSGVPEVARALLSADVLKSKKFALINLKRLGGVQEEIESLGERLSHQSFVAQKLKLSQE